MPGPRSDPGLMKLLSKQTWNATTRRENAPGDIRPTRIVRRGQLTTDLCPDLRIPPSVTRRHNQVTAALAT